MATFFIVLAVAFAMITIADALVIMKLSRDVARLSVCDKLNSELIAATERQLKDQEAEIYRLDEKRFATMRTEISRLEALIAREALSRHAADDKINDLLQLRTGPMR